MYIRFEDKNIIYSFNTKELEQLKKIKEAFSQYGKIERDKLQNMMIEELSVKIVPIMYLAYTNKNNIKVDIPEEYKESVYENRYVYLEYGLALRSYIEQYRIGFNPLPKYLYDEVSKYIYYRKSNQIKFATSTELDSPLYIDKDIYNNNPYNSKVQIDENNIFMYMIK